jgi:hypothetical protein
MALGGDEATASLCKHHSNHSLLSIAADISHYCSLEREHQETQDMSERERASAGDTVRIYLSVIIVRTGYKQANTVVLGQENIRKVVYARNLKCIRT